MARSKEHEYLPKLPLQALTYCTTTSHDGDDSDRNSKDQPKYPTTRHASSSSAATGVARIGISAGRGSSGAGGDYTRAASC